MRLFKSWWLICVWFLQAMCACSASAISFTLRESQSNNHFEAAVWLNPFTLTLGIDALRAWETAPKDRLVIGIKDFVFSLQLVDLLTGVAFVDEFSVGAFYLSLLEDTNGQVRLFTQEIDKEKVLTKERKDKLEEAKEDAPHEFIVPCACISNITVRCDQMYTRERLWSFDRGLIMLKNLKRPVEADDPPTEILMKSDINDNTNSSIAIAVAARAAPENPFLDFSVDLNNAALGPIIVRAANGESKTNAGPGTTTQIEVTAGTKGVQMATKAVKSDGKKKRKRKEQVEDFFETYFSNTWAKVSANLSNELARIEQREQMSNFFATANVSNLILDAHVHIAVSNDVILPGHLEMAFIETNATPPRISFAFQITNCSPWLIEVPSAKH